MQLPEPGKASGRQHHSHRPPAGGAYFDGSRLYPVTATTTTAISALPRSSPAVAGAATTYGCRALPVSGIAADPGSASSRLQSLFLTQLIFHVFIQLLNTDAVRSPGQTVLRRPLFSLPRLSPFLSIQEVFDPSCAQPQLRGILDGSEIRLRVHWWQYNEKIVCLPPIRDDGEAGRASIREVPRRARRELRECMEMSRTCLTLARSDAPKVDLERKPTA